MNDPVSIPTPRMGTAGRITPTSEAAMPQPGAEPTPAFVIPESAPPPSPPNARPQTVREAIADAAQRTSVDYNYLIAQAELESGLDPRARASTSTATGLFQFLETTWLATVKRHGPRFGYGEVADQIQLFSNGRPYVADRGQRDAILALRNDAQMASLMAAGFAEDNRAALTPVLGRQPGHGELYLAHFLGAGGARRFLTELQRNQGQSAAAVFPEAAAANRAIFYGKDGSPRSLAGVMELIDGKMTRALARVGGGGADQRANAPFAPLAITSAGFAADRSGVASASNPPPYVIADEAVFEPISPPVITGASRAGSGVSGPGPVARSLSMSTMLRATFGGDGGPALASPQGAAQVRRAYDQLKAFGL